MGDLRTRGRALVLAAVLAGMATACGGGGEPARAASAGRSIVDDTIPVDAEHEANVKTLFIAQSNQICKEEMVLTEIALPAGVTPEEYRAYFDRVATVVRRIAERMRALDVPVGQERRIDEILDTMDDTALSWAELAHTLVTLDAAQAERVQVELFREMDWMDRITSDYGITECSWGLVVGTR